MIKLLYKITAVSTFAGLMGRYYRMKERRISRYIASAVICLLWGPLFCYYMTKGALIELGFIKEKEDD